MDERKERLLKAAKVLSGLKYSDWHTLCDIVSHLYKRKLGEREYELLSTPLELDEIETGHYLNENGINPILYAFIINIDVVLQIKGFIIFFWMDCWSVYRRTVHPPRGR